MAVGATAELGTRTLFSAHAAHCRAGEGRRAGPRRREGGLLYYTILCYAILCYAIQYYNTLQYTIPYDTTLHCTILHRTAGRGEEGGTGGGGRMPAARGPRRVYRDYGEAMGRLWGGYGEQTYACVKNNVREAIESYRETTGSLSGGYGEINGEIMGRLWGGYGFSSQKRRAAVVPRINSERTGRKPLVNRAFCSSSVYIAFCSSAFLSSSFVCSFSLCCSSSFWCSFSSTERFVPTFIIF